MTDSTLFQGKFVITKVDPLKYDRVVRLSANTENGETIITLDVNSELFPCAKDDRLDLLVASTLSLDGSKDDAKGWRDIGRGEASLADEWDYVCHGKIYRFEEAGEDNMKVFVSFGGLLLYIEGLYKNLTSLRQDYVYLCLRK